MFNISKAVGGDRSSICGHKMDSSPTRASDDTGRRTKLVNQRKRKGSVQSVGQQRPNGTRTAYDSNGQKTGDDWCSVCAMKNKRDVEKAAKGNDYANCTCLVCGGSNLPAWKTASIYLSSWEERNSDEYFRKQRDRRDCWHCCRRFQKQAIKPVSNKEWRYVRYWCPFLKEWTCSLCHVKGRDGGCFGITISHLKNSEIRCEDCHCLYAMTLGKKSLDRTQDTNITWDRIICGNCYQERNKNLDRNANRKAKTNASGELVFPNKQNYPLRPKELTWQEWAGKGMGDGPFPQTKLAVVYLLRTYGWANSG